MRPGNIGSVVGPQISKLVLGGHLTRPTLRSPHLPAKERYQESDADQKWCEDMGGAPWVLIHVRMVAPGAGKDDSLDIRPTAFQPVQTHGGQ
jgi:hypothetical protein